MILTIISFCIFSYLLGSIPFGLLFTKILTSKDLRKTGSGNIGATNAARTGGWTLGLATLACDILKGAMPVLIASKISPGNEEISMALTAIAAVCGHLFPVYLKFKTGGKGVATAAGCFAVFAPAALGIAVGAFFFTALISKRVSAGSMAAALCLPVSVLWINQSLIFFGCAVVISLAIIFRHKDNIRRLFAGTEPKFRKD